jgi:hypothetical protein
LGDYQYKIFLSLLRLISSNIINIIYYINIDNTNYSNDKLDEFYGNKSKIYFVLLSGWTTKIPNDSHAVNVVIERTDKTDLYNFYIINSGGGINYHYKQNRHYNDINIFKSPVVIKYDYIEISKIKTIFQKLHVI